MLHKLLDPVTSPFIEIPGGPDFDDCELRRVDFGSGRLSFYLPRPRFGKSNRCPESIDLEDRSRFGHQDDSRTYHEALDLGVSNWAYFPPRLALSRLTKPRQQAYVVVTTSWCIERTKDDIRLPQEDLSFLEKYLRDDYIASLESEGGVNWKIRQREYEDMGPRGRNASQEIIDSAIQAQIIKPPAGYSRVAFGETPWLQYVWAPKFENQPRALIYSTVLDPQTLLTVVFHLTQMTPDSVEHWWKSLVRDSERLMTGVEITFSPQMENL